LQEKSKEPGATREKEIGWEKRGAGTRGASPQTYRNLVCRGVRGGKGKVTQDEETGGGLRTECQLRRPVVKGRVLWRDVGGGKKSGHRKMAESELRRQGKGEKGTRKKSEFMSGKRPTQ